MGNIFEIWLRVGDLTITKPVRTKTKCHLEPGEPQLYMLKHEFRADMTPQSKDFLYAYMDVNYLTVDTHLVYYDVKFESREDAFTIAMTTPLSGMPLLINHYCSEIRCIANWRLKYGV
jgi:hypothetical protein